MNILFINDYRDKIGGAEIYMYLLKKELEKCGHDVRLFTSTISTKDYIETIDHPTKKTLLKRLFNTSSYWRMKKLLKNYTPDVVHIHGLFNELTPSVLLPLKAFPILMTVHNDQIVSAFTVQQLGRTCKKLVCPGCSQCVGVVGALYEKMKRGLHSFLLARITVFICPSNYMREIVEKGGFSPCVLVSNCITPLRYTPISSYSEILFVGRLTTGKGSKYLVEAFAKVRRKHPTAHLTIIGSGPEKEELEELITRLSCTKSVTMHTSLTPEEVVTYYAKAAIVCVPSIFYDNLPTVCLEALFSGRALVGSNVGGIPEVIRPMYNGYLVPEGNSKALAQVLGKLLSEKKTLKEFSYHSLELAKKFTISQHLSEVLSLYQQVRHELSL